MCRVFFPLLPLSLFPNACPIRCRHLRTQWPQPSFVNQIHSSLSHNSLLPFSLIFLPFGDFLVSISGVWKSNKWKSAPIIIHSAVQVNGRQMNGMPLVPLSLSSVCGDTVSTPDIFVLRADASGTIHLAFTVNNATSVCSNSDNSSETAASAVSSYWSV